MHSLFLVHSGFMQICVFYTDDTSRQITALMVLVTSMKCATEKDIDPLCYIYQQYDVRKYLITLGAHVQRGYGSWVFLSVLNLLVVSLFVLQT